MSSYFHCALYSDIDSTIRIDKDAVFIGLTDEKNDVDLHITLNPFQVLTLAKYLYAAVTEIKVSDIFKSQFLGNMTFKLKMKISTRKISKFRSVVMTANFSITMKSQTDKISIFASPQAKVRGLKLFYGG